MEEITKLTGWIVHVVYHNSDNLYTVLRFRLQSERDRTITCTGILPEMEMGVLYTFYGTYVEHPRYGMQFQINSFEKLLPSESDAVIRYLSSSQFPGIGKKTAERIVEKLGENCLSLIREDATVLQRVPDLTDDKIEVIRQGLSQDDEGIGELVRFMNVHGIGYRSLTRLNRAYGKDALAKISENPYRVIEECDGFGFETADRIGKSLGIADNDRRRQYGYLVSLAMDLCVQSGDSYVMEDELKSQFEKKMGADQDFASLLSDAVAKRTLVEEEKRIYPATQYDSETFTASFLSSFPYQSLDPVDRADLDGYLASMEKQLGIHYDDKQVDAIHAFFDHPFLIVTGGPGTGKTTVVEALVKLFHLLYPDASIVCAAPTGRAAKHLADVTGTDSCTLHSLLKWDPDTNEFGADENNPIDADLLIIDEFSMVDDWLFCNLLKASRSVSRICVIGDEDQLPSVSPGSVLRDLIASECFPLVRLDHIYRQKQGSDVIELAHQIHEGHADFSQLQNDVRFYECNDEPTIRSQIIEIVKMALEKGYTMNEIQVLSPMYRSICGIDSLNNALQNTFNPLEPGAKVYKSGDRQFRVHDKILQLKNQPDDDVYNGDIGILEEIDDAKETIDHQTTLIVNFDDTLVEYKGDTLSNITLAYCISIHKSQGCEYPIVIMPITNAFHYMLQRKLIYTGCTRARQALILIGSQQAFQQGIRTEERHVRRTTLKEKIQKAMGH